jgi:hypothetical protein
MCRHVPPPFKQFISYDVVDVTGIKPCTFYVHEHSSSIDSHVYHLALGPNLQETKTSVAAGMSHEGLDSQLPVSS